MADLDIKWQPMSTAPRDGRYVCLKPKPGHTYYSAPGVMQWNNLGTGNVGWWLEEGAMYQDDSFEGWSPVPDDGDRP